MFYEVRLYWYNLFMSKPLCEDCGKQLNKYTARWCKEHGYIHRKRPSGLKYKIVAVNKAWFKFRGGWVDSKGYRWLKIDGRKAREHVFVIEKHLGRRLRTNEVVHHIDGNKLNNTLENLQLLTKDRHDRHHNGKARKGVVYE